jgi:hypothetical protein
MDQITIKKPNPKGRLFLKIDLERDLAAGVYLSEAPSPSSFLFGLAYKMYKYILLGPCTYSHRAMGVGGGGCEPVKRLEGQQFTKLGRTCIPT